MKRSIAAVAAVAALALTLTACGNDAVPTDPTADAGTTETDAGSATDDTTEETEDSALSGSIKGAGASSQEKGQNAWAAEFAVATGVDVAYNPVGSGDGRKSFIEGAVLYAGSDSAMGEDEIESANARCFGSEVIEVPLWISPIAVVYNIPALNDTHVNLSPVQIADIFSGKITNWNDASIVAANPDIELPDLAIVPVNRTDQSGTTKNFQQYLIDAAGDAWPYEAEEVWPIEGTQSGQGSSGLLEVVAGAEGTIGYVDASRVGDLGSVAVGVGDEYVPFSSEAAAKIVDISAPTSDATDLRLTIDLARDTTESGVYPVVLVSYLIACSTYDNAQDAANVQAYLTYIASEEGQNLAADPEVGGIAPISADLRTKVNAALDQIAAN